jgi:ornithine--oxo-acid transaminase
MIKTHTASVQTLDYRKKAQEIYDRASQLTTEDTLAFIHNHVANNYHLLSEDPVVRAEGVWLYTKSGKKVLDGVAAYSAANLGHNHPLVLETAKLFHENNCPPVLGRFLPTSWLALLGQKITEMTGFQKYLPTNGGVEAPETALKLARRWGSFVKKVRGTPEILWCTGAFHGRTLTMTQFFDDPEGFDGFGPFIPGFIEIPYGDISAVKERITDKTIAIIVEPIQGEGGINIPPENYFPELRKLATKHNFLLILDEVQTGWGRTGKLFAWEHFGKKCRPDILCVAKSLSGGFAPVGGILADDPLMSLLKHGSHGSTYGGCPLSSAVSLAALNAIELEKLPERSQKMGKYVLERLEAIQEKSKHILCLRGQGLMIGIEVRHDGPAASHFAHQLCDLGLICKDTNTWVLRFTPPLIAVTEELDFALSLFEKVFTI